MDIMGSVQTFSELNCDNGSKWSCAQADIAKFYDTICPLGIARSLIQHGVPISEACFAARLHSSPTITLTIASTSRSIASRTRGLLTGSASAALLAIVPLLDIWENIPRCVNAEALPLEPMAYIQLVQSNISDTTDTTWRHWLLITEDTRRSEAPKWQELPHCAKHLGVMAWADNLFTFAVTTAGAMIRMEAIATFLNTHWGLSIKAASKELLLAPGHDECTPMPGWEVNECMKALGHVLEGSGATDARQDSTPKAAWRAYWRQFKGVAKTLGTWHRLRHMRRCVDPIVRFRCSRWLWTKTAASRLKAQQRRMTLPLLAVRKATAESWEDFAKRRERAYKECDLQGWDALWASSVATWHKHLDRHADLAAAMMHNLSVLQDDVNFHRITFMALIGVRHGFGAHRLIGQPRCSINSMKKLTAVLVAPGAPVP
jgi:hypothetical protein